MSYDEDDPRTHTHTESKYDDDLDEKGYFNKDDPRDFIPKRRYKKQFEHSGYHPVHLQLKKSHVKKLIQGKGIRLDPDTDIHPSGDYGAVLTYLPTHTAKKVRTHIRNGKNFILKMSPHDLHYNAQLGGSIWDDVLGGIGSVGDFLDENGILDIVETVVPKYGSLIKGGVKVVSALANKGAGKDTLAQRNKKKAQEKAQQEALKAREAALREKQRADAAKLKAKQQAARAKLQPSRIPVRKGRGIIGDDDCFIRY